MGLHGLGIVQHTILIEILFDFPAIRELAAGVGCLVDTGSIFIMRGPGLGRLTYLG
jgi:hypothetical protein